MLLRGLSKDPAQRFRSCGEFIAAHEGRAVSRKPDLGKWAVAAVPLAVVAAGALWFSTRQLGWIEVAVIAPTEIMNEANREPQAAQRRQTAADEAMRAARAANAEREAGHPWREALAAARTAQEAFDKADFDAASKAWKTSAEKFQASETQARSIAAYRQAKSAYETARASDLALLPSRGGERWRDVEKRARVGGAAESDPEAGRPAYEPALAGLPEAVKEARAAQRLSQIASALDRARSAKGRQDWSGVVAAANEALALDTGNREAQALKTEAEGHIDPTAGNLLGMAFVEVKAGSFSMGSTDGDSDEKPVRTVRITRDFWMGKHEVTQREYQALMGSNPSHFKGDDLPVERVSWHDAVRFCEEMTRREQEAGRLASGMVYRLPTEAEWEYAARGGAKSRGFTYAGGNDIGAVAWYGGSGGRRTQRVGAKTANELGLHDMSGNVWEWCHDWYQSYSGLATTDPSGPSSGSLRVFRGGSWFNVASACRVAYRNYFFPSFMNYFLGFRVVLAVPVSADVPRGAMADRQ